MTARACYVLTRCNKYGGGSAAAAAISPNEVTKPVVLSGFVSHLASNFRAAVRGDCGGSRGAYSLLIFVEDVYSIADKVRILRRRDDCSLHRTSLYVCIILKQTHFRDNVRG